MKWEYLVDEVGTRDLQTELDRRGAAGWELVQVRFVAGTGRFDTDGYELIFKREL
jgi:hypothetical protein